MVNLGAHPPNSQILWKTKLFVMFWAFSLWIPCIFGLIQDRPVADFQLTGGATPNEGRLEVRLPNTTRWHGICKDSFYPLYASIICQDLGWWSACQRLATNDRLTPLPTQSGDAMNSILTLQASCFGSESSLWECNDVNFVNASDTCKAGEDVWLVCLGNSNDLEVRLSGGNFEGEGYVEMRCPGQKWNTVCAQDWDTRDADTVCRQLGFPWSYSTRPEADPGVNLGEIGYGRVWCTGAEDLMGECAFTVEEECHSFSSEIAGVQCGVEFNQYSADALSVSLCGGHHCSHERSKHPISDPRKQCRCDCLCTRLDDCCFDVSNHDTSCNDTIWKDIAPSFFDMFECVAVPGSEISHTAYVLISKCPDVVTEAVDRTMCEMERDFNDVIGLLPVYDSNGLVYKNIFCAICNGLTVQDVSQWGVRLNYDVGNGGGGYVNPSLIISVFGDFVGFEILPSGAQARRCPYDIIDTCPSNTTSEPVEINNCAFFFAPVTFNNILYRNLYCAKCNGVDLPQTQYCTECAEECPQDPFLPCFEAPCPGVVTFETVDVQFSLDAFFGGVYGEAEAVSCPSGEIYDPFLRQCTSIPCTPSYNRSMGICDQQTTTVESTPMSSTTYAATTSHDLTTPHDTPKTPHSTLSCFLREIGLDSHLKGIFDTITSSLQDGEYSASSVGNCTEATPVSLSLVFIYYDQAIPLIEAIDTAFADGTKLYSGCPVCNITNINIYLKSQGMSAALRNRCKMFFEPQSEVYPGLSDDVNNSAFLALVRFNITENMTDTSRAPDYCIEENQQTCVTTALTPSEYQVINDDSRDIWLLQLNMSVHKEDYVLQTGGTVRVCSTLLLTPWPFRSIYEFAVIACTGLSVVALLVTFFIYCTNSRLRDVPGKCLLNMIAALAVGLLLSVLSEFFLFHPIACTAAAAVAHFAWLSTFGWLTLFASVIAIGVNNRKTGLFCKIFIFGWLIPAIAIGLCLLIHFCQCMNVELSYGRESHCWLQGSEALLFSMVVPIGVLLLVSIVALICGIIRIRKVTEFVTAFSEEITEYSVSDVLLYIAMCLLLIIPWTLAATYILLHIKILNDVYRIAYSLQGVFVFAALISTGNVRMLCKQKQPPPPVEGEEKPSGVTRQLSKKLDAPDGASNRVWLKRHSSHGGDIERVIGGENTWL